jgi:hypothetical protein
MDLIILDSTTKSLRIVLAEAHTANPVDIICNYADATSSALTEGNNPSQSNGVTQATILAAPAAATARIVRTITVYNNDTVEHTFTINLLVTATVYQIVSKTLAAGESWNSNETAAAAAGGGVTDHGALSGLADDDHTQYFKDGSQDLAGGAYQLSGFKGLQNVQTDSYTTVDSDLGKVIVMNKATGVTVTVHQGAAADFNCLVIQKGAGQVTFAAGGTGAIRNRSSHTKIAGQYGMASVYVESNAGTAPQVYIAGDTGA